MTKIGIVACAVLRTLLSALLWLATGIGETVGCFAPVLAMMFSGTMGLLFVNDFWDGSRSVKTVRLLVAATICACWIALAVTWIPSFMAGHMLSSLGVAARLLVILCMAGALISIATTAFLTVCIMAMSIACGLADLFRDSMDQCMERVGK